MSLDGFSEDVMQAFAQSEQITLSAGDNTGHRFLGIWVVVANGNVYIRSWTGNPQGWYGVLVAQPIAQVEVAEQRLTVRAIPTRELEINEAVSEAYHHKYDATWPTYATDMTQPASVATTIQLLPAALV